MKIATLAIVAATLLPAVAIADSSQPNSAPGAAAPAATQQNTTGMNKSTTGAADSSVPGATNPNKSSAPSHTGAPRTTKAGDSSVPGATNPNK